MCDSDAKLAEEAAARVRHLRRTRPTTSALLERDDIDVIDVVTGDGGHFELTMAALEAGKHVLVEKPVAHDFRDTLRARDLAAAKGLKTKVGFTFRYSPASATCRS